MDTPTESTFMEFILYNNWANQQVLRACQDLSEAQLAMAIPGAYGTIRATLGHIIGAEAHYLDLLTGSSPQPSFDWKAGPDLAALTAYATRVGEALVAMAGNVHPTDEVVEEDQGKQYYYQALAVFIQIINHGIEHRTNVTTILNQGLQKPPDVDGWGYMSAHPHRFDVK